MITIEIRRRQLPATTQIQLAVLGNWIAYLYDQLRAAEARAADDQLPAPSRDAAAWTARYLARAIGDAEAQRRLAYQQR